MKFPTSLACATALLITAATSSGCVTHQHHVGLGPTGTGTTSQRQFYAFFGLWQVNEVDTQRMAADLTSYSIDTRYSIVDLLLAPVLLPLTVTSRTVTVRT